VRSDLRCDLNNATWPAYLFFENLFDLREEFKRAKSGVGILRQAAAKREKNRC
jgi:hypothetical protein